MIDFEYPVDCPLMGEEIDEDTCFDIHGVVDWHSPKSEAPDRVYETANYADVCRDCKFHRFD